MDPGGSVLPELRGAVTHQGMAAIGQAIARVRKEQGFSQQEMAQEIGVSQSVYSAYERGALRIHGELLASIAKRFSISVDELLGLQSAKTSTAVKDRRFLRRMQKIDRLSKRDKDALLRTIDAFLAKS